MDFFKSYINENCNVEINTARVFFHELHFYALNKM